MAVLLAFRSNRVSASLPLGLALTALGVRESGTEHLDQAVIAYRAALEENTRDRVPLQWAYTQHAMANALATLAKRENSATRLREAIMCMQGAAEEYDKAGETYWLPVARRGVAAMKEELSQMHD